MSNVLIVYCSMTGNTKAAAEAVAIGARSGGAQVVVKAGIDAKASDLLDCDAVALGSYDAFSYMGGGLKEFFDQTFYPTQNQITDKPYIAFLTHGGGGKAIDSIEAVAKTFKLKKIADSILVKGHPDSEAVNKLKELGVKLATALR